MSGFQTSSWFRSGPDCSIQIGSTDPAFQSTIQDPNYQGFNWTIHYPTRPGRQSGNHQGTGHHPGCQILYPIPGRLRHQSGRFRQVQFRFPDQITSAIQSKYPTNNSNSTPLYQSNYPPTNIQSKSRFQIQIQSRLLCPILGSCCWRAAVLALLAAAGAGRSSSSWPTAYQIPDFFQIFYSAATSIPILFYPAGQALPGVPGATRHQIPGSTATRSRPSPDTSSRFHYPVPNPIPFVPGSRHSIHARFQTFSGFWLSGILIQSGFWAIHPVSASGFWHSRLFQVHYYPTGCHHCWLLLDYRVSGLSRSIHRALSGTRSNQYPDPSNPDYPAPYQLQPGQVQAPNQYSTDSKSKSTYSISIRAVCSGANWHRALYLPGSNYQTVPVPPDRPTRQFQHWHQAKSGRDPGRSNSRQGQSRPDPTRSGADRLFSS